MISCMLHMTSDHHTSALHNLGMHLMFAHDLMVVPASVQDARPLLNLPVAGRHSAAGHGGSRVERRLWCRRPTAVHDRRTLCVRHRRAQRRLPSLRRRLPARVR